MNVFILIQSYANHMHARIHVDYNYMIVRSPQESQECLHCSWLAYIPGTFLAPGTMFE